MFLKLSVNVLFIYIVAVSAQSAVFRKDYKYDENFNTFYKEHRVKVSWYDAKASCISENAELALPCSIGEAELMASLLSSDTEEVWLWLTDLFAPGEFYTANGSVPDSLHINWKAGEPNPYDKSCAVMEKSGFYRDIDCKRKAMFMCYKRNNGIIIDPKCQTYDTEYEYAPATKHCYKLHKKFQNWSGAFKTCKNELATLAIINSEAESGHLSNYLKKQEKKLFINRTLSPNVLVDFSDLVVEGLPETHRGQNLKDAGWNEWGNNQPDGVGKDHCGSILWSGKLDDVSCDLRAMFFCEKEDIASA